MQDYKKLVDALRCCAGVHTKPTKCPDYDDSWCDGKCLDKHLIAAADAIEALQEQVRMLDKHDTDLHNEGYDVGYYAGRRDWEPKRGEWVRVEDEESYHYECSRCGERPLYSRYGDVVLSGVCPMCGAKMEVQDDWK